MASFLLIHSLFLCNSPRLLKVDASDQNIIILSIIIFKLLFVFFFLFFVRSYVRAEICNQCTSTVKARRGWGEGGTTSASHLSFALSSACAKKWEKNETTMQSKPTLGVLK